jgi:class 3 adenylate cyclase
MLSPAARACVARLWRENLSGDRVERRLAAILAADVAGYSRLMGADEESALVRCAIVRDRPKI